MRKKQNRPIEVHTTSFVEDYDEESFENFCKEIPVCPILVENQEQGLGLNESEIRRLKQHRDLITTHSYFRHSLNFVKEAIEEKHRYFDAKSIILNHSSQQLFSAVPISKSSQKARFIHFKKMSSNIGYMKKDASQIFSTEIDGTNTHNHVHFDPKNTSCLTIPLRELLFKFDRTILQTVSNFTHTHQFQLPDGT